VVISAVLLTSYVSSLRLFPERGTHVLQTVNQRPVTTMASFREALAHPVVRHKRKYLEIQTNQVSALCAINGSVETRNGGNEGGTMVVVPLDVATKEEPRLRKMHQYLDDPYVRVDFDVPAFHRKMQVRPKANGARQHLRLLRGMLQRFEQVHVLNTHERNAFGRVVVQKNHLATVSAAYHAWLIIKKNQKT
jgi:hypothetical protein